MGVLLVFHFSLFIIDVWFSVYYIQYEVVMGFLICGIYYFGFSVMVVLILLYMIQIFLYGVYKVLCEVNWFSGFVLLGIVLGLSLIGYFLFWD